MEAHNATSDEFTQKDVSGIKTYLNNYRFVENVRVNTSDLLLVTVDSGCDFHDSDAVIGLLVRRFDLEYLDEEDNTLHFKK